MQTQWSRRETLLYRHQEKNLDKIALEKMCQNKKQVSQDTYYSLEKQTKNSGSKNHAIYMFCWNLAAYKDGQDY